MFNSIIRRKTGRTFEEDEAAFESTTFSLTTAVPRPVERVATDGLPIQLRLGKLTNQNGEQLIRIRNISAGGLAAEHRLPLAVGDETMLDMGTQQIPSSVVWIRDGMCGIKFAENIDLGELLAGRKPRHGFRPRPPRLEVECKASLRLGKMYYTVDVEDVSLGGIKVEPIAEYCLGKDVVVIVESLRPIKGAVRWYADRKAGIVFDEPLTFEELAEWMGKRLEMAALKASIKRI